MKGSFVFEKKIAHSPPRSGGECENALMEFEKNVIEGIDHSLERIERSNERLGTKLEDLRTIMETQHEERCRLLDDFCLRGPYGPRTQEDLKKDVSIYSKEYLVDI